jgi:type II secretory pathway pseudopilin PulG
LRFPRTELIICAILLIILIGASLPFLFMMIQGARTTACQVSLRQLGDVVAAYRADVGFNPRRPEDLTQPSKLDDRPYLSKVPSCPVDGRPYDYNFLTGRFSCDKLEHRVIYD